MTSWPSFTLAETVLLHIPLVFSELLRHAMYMRSIGLAV